MCHRRADLRRRVAHRRSSRWYVLSIGSAAFSGECGRGGGPVEQCLEVFDVHFIGLHGKQVASGLGAQPFRFGQWSPWSVPVGVRNCCCSVAAHRVGGYLHGNDGVGSTEQGSQQRASQASPMVASCALESHPHRTEDPELHTARHLGNRCPTRGRGTPVGYSQGIDHAPTLCGVERG